MNLKNEKKGIKKGNSKKRNRKQGATSHIWAGPLARAGGGGAACTFFSSSDYVWNTGLFLKNMIFYFLNIDLIFRFFMVCKQYFEIMNIL